MKSLQLTWTQVKGLIDDKVLLYNAIPRSYGYDILAIEDTYSYETSVYSTGNVPGGYDGDASADYGEFVGTYLANANRQLEVRNFDGTIKNYSTPRPSGTTAVFIGVGDDTGYGDGSQILFKMLSTDTEKSIDLDFSCDLYFTSGGFAVEGAPFGATLSVDIVHPTTGVMVSPVVRYPVFGDRDVHFQCNDAALLNQGLTLRVTVKNALGTGDHDAPAAFKLAGWFKMFRPSNLCAA